MKWVCLLLSVRIYFLIIDLVYDRDNCKYFKFIMVTQQPTNPVSNMEMVTYL